MTPGAARWLRRAEIALSVVGVSLLGGALAAVLDARLYQARQERAFLDVERNGASPSREVVSSPAPEPPSAPPVVMPAPAPAVDPRLLGRLEIPRIGVSAMVREGDDRATLAVAVGHVPDTALPGEKGNVVLAGHRDSFFRALRHVRVDDVVRFRALGRRFEYRVESTEVVGPNEGRVLDSKGDAVLTLVTCYPFEWVGRAPSRFVVRARLSPPGAVPASP